jgi:uncharacterized protein YjiS (DUF1127 family)
MYILGYIHYLSHRLGRKLAQREPRRGTEGRVNRCLSVLKSWRERQATIRTLEGLSDTALRDIGVDRADIQARVAAAIPLAKPRSDRASFPAAALDARRKVLGCC